MAPNCSHSIAAHVCIVCGQGVYWRGRYYSEYHDRELYLRHAMAVSRIVAEFGYTHAVCSGGCTQPACRKHSEARCFPDMWAATGTIPACPVHFDESALDTPQNLLFGLMEARRALGPGVPIHRIGVLIAWSFKKPRVANYALSLGIAEQCYVHGISVPQEPTVWAPSGHSTSMPTKAEFDADLDHILLLLGRDAEAKRRRRWGGDPAHWSAAELKRYEERLQPLRADFPRTFTALDKLAGQIGEFPSGLDRATLEALDVFTPLRAAFREEVIEPR